MQKKFRRTLFIKGIDKTYPPIKVFVETHEMLYEKEFFFLLELLVNNFTLEPLYCFFEDGGRVAVIKTFDSTVARTTIHVKGPLKQQIYLAVSLGSEYQRARAWFQLAFLGFKVRFRKTILHPRTSWTNDDAPHGP